MFSNYLQLLLLSLFITACNPPAKINHIETKVYPLGTPGFETIDSGVYKSVLPYKNDLDGKMDIVVGYSEQAMEKGQPEGLLGNFVADLSLEQANKIYHAADHKPVDFCFLNNGGLRAALPKGNLTKRKIFEVMPFENELIVLTLDGKSTGMLLDFIANKGGMPVSGLRLVMKNKKAVDVMIGNNSFDSSLTYKIVTSDYLANGGDNLSFLAEIKTKENLGLKLRDAILNYLEEKKSLNQTIKVSLDNRISDAK